MVERAVDPYLEWRIALLVVSVQESLICLDGRVALREITERSIELIIVHIDVALSQVDITILLCLMSFLTWYLLWRCFLSLLDL